MKGISIEVFLGQTSHFSFEDCEDYVTCMVLTLSSSCQRPHFANPIELGEKLVGCSFDLIAQDGSPKGKKYFIFYNPYFDGSNSGEYLVTPPRDEKFAPVFCEESPPNAVFHSLKKNGRANCFMVKNGG